MKLLKYRHTKMVEENGLPKHYLIAHGIQKVVSKEYKDVYKRQSPNLFKIFNKIIV